MDFERETQIKEYKDAILRGEALPAVDSSIQQDAVLELIASPLEIDDMSLLNAFERGLLPLTFPHAPQPFEVALKHRDISIALKILELLPELSKVGVLGDVTSPNILKYAYRRMTPSLVAKFQRLSAPINVSALPASSTYKAYVEKSVPVDLRKAQQLFIKNGSYCTTEGFYQHLGECWNDTTQMLLCYTTGVGPIVQEKLLFVPIEFLLAKVRLDPQKTMMMTTYLKAMRNRLVRSILNEDVRHTVCSSEEVTLAKLQRLRYGGLRARGLNAKISALFSGERHSLPEALTLNYEHLPDYGVFDVTSILDIVMTIFDLHSKVDVKNIPHEHVATTFDSILGIELVHRVTKTAFHIICFLRCGGVDYYYNNNVGIFPFDWHDLFRDLQTHKAARLAFKTFYKGGGEAIPWPCIEEGDTVRTYDPVTQRPVTMRADSPQIIESYKYPVDDAIVFLRREGVVFPAEKGYRPYVVGRGSVFYARKAAPDEPNSLQRAKLWELLRPVQHGKGRRSKTRKGRRPHARAARSSARRLNR